MFSPPDTARTRPRDYKTHSQLGERLRDARKTSTDTAVALASPQLRDCSSTVLHFVDEPPRDTAEKKHTRECQASTPSDIFRPHDVENADNACKIKDNLPTMAREERSGSSSR